MRKGAYSEEQILKVLREVESGKSIAEVARGNNIAEQTIQRWRNRYGGCSESHLRRLKELEAENLRLKKIVADQAIDISALKEILKKEW